MTGADAEFGALAAIVAMAVATYLIRAAGFWIMGSIALTPQLRRLLDALPGSVVAATIVPIVVKSGPSAALGVAAVAALMIYRRNEFLAVFAGVGVVALARAAGL